MAKPRKMPKGLILTLIPFILSLLAAALLIVVLTAGSSPSALTSLYLLKVNTTALSIPPKLSSSAYLTDLTRLTTQNLIGTTQTSQSLSLSPTYTIHIFTCCSTSSCTAPLIGPSFNPLHNLRLEATSFAGPSRGLDGALGVYRGVAPVMGICLILAFVLDLAAPSVKLLEGKVGRKARIVSVGMGILGAALLIVGCVAGQVGMARFSGAMNSEFGTWGITVQRGSLVYPAWAAVPLMCANIGFLLLKVPHRPIAPKSPRPEGKAEGKGKDVARQGDTSEETSVTAGGGSSTRVPSGYDASSRDSRVGDAFRDSGMAMRDSGSAMRYSGLSGVRDSGIRDSPWGSNVGIAMTGPAQKQGQEEGWQSGSALGESRDDGSGGVFSRKPVRNSGGWYTAYKPPASG